MENIRTITDNSETNELAECELCKIYNKPNAETLAAFAETEEMIRTGKFKTYNSGRELLLDILGEEYRKQLEEDEA